MYKKNKIDAFGAFLLIIFSLLLGLNQVLIKIVNSGIQPVFQAGLRSLLAILPVLIFLFFFKKKIIFSKLTLVPGIISGIIFSIEFIFLFVALDYSSVARVSVLFYSMPVFLCILAHFFIPNESLNFLKLVGLFLAIIGIILVLSSKESLTNINLFGDVLTLLASFCWALIVLLNRITSLRLVSPEVQFLYQIIISSIILLPLSLFFGDLIREINFSIILIFCFQILIIFTFGFIMWFWILSIYPASAMASFSFLAPIFGVFFGWLFLNENITQSIIISLVMVSLGIIFINIKRKPNFD